MLVVLHTKSRHGRAQRIQLRSHQVAKFGKSEWADYSFSNDRVMSDMHFEVRCVPEGCRLLNLDKDAVTLVNGEEISGPTFLKDGDELQAGTTVLSVTVEGQTPTASSKEEPQPPLPQPADDSPPPIAEVAATSLSVVAACSYLELADGVIEVAKEKENEDDVIQTLSDQEQYLDALRVRAFLLPKRDSVWWGCVCVQDEIIEDLDEPQNAALQAAIRWVTDPSEENRRLAEDASNAVRNQGSGGMLALAAFWSEGSIGQTSGPHIPADDRLVCQGVSAALVTAAYTGDASKAEERLKTFVEKGKKVAAGEIPPPEKAGDES